MVFKQFPKTFWIANTMEIFERMAWYGFFAVGGLYMTAPLAEGGLGLTDVQRGVILGIIPFLLYLFPVVTGAFADKFGYKRTFFIAYAILVQLALAITFDLYRPESWRNRDFILARMAALGISLAAALAIGTYVVLPWRFGRGLLALTLLLSLPLETLLRIVWIRVTKRPPSRRALAIGEGPIVGALEEVLTQRPSPPFRIVRQLTAPEEINGNLLLTTIMEPEIRFVGGHEDDLGPKLESVAQELRESGRSPYVIHRFGSVPEGTPAYVNAFRELEGQVKEQGLGINKVVVSSAAGTYGGLCLGALAVDSGIEVTGIAISERSENWEDKLAALINETADHLGLDIEFGTEDINVNTDHIGGGYAVPTEGMVDAIKLAAQTEGVLLDGLDEPARFGLLALWHLLIDLHWHHTGIRL